MLQGAMLVWFLLTLLSLLFVMYDTMTNTPVSWVQKLAWILVTAYTGAFGLFMYLLTCRSPFEGGHDHFTKPLWKQGVNSEMHCLAGDATGIIIGAILFPFFHLANGYDIIVEYISGFICGLFIFQSLMMMSVYNHSYLKALQKTFFAETVSMNLVMTGMVPFMVILEEVWPTAASPFAWEFWFRMSLATLAGGIVAFPINWFLVAKGEKHGCMTVPGDHVSVSEHKASHKTMMHAAHTKSPFTLTQKLFWIFLTYGILIAVTYLTHVFFRIHFHAYIKF